MVSNFVGLGRGKIVQSRSWSRTSRSYLQPRCFVASLSSYLSAKPGNQLYDYCFKIIILGRGEWIQVDLRNPTRVVAVVTQGLNWITSYDEWVTSYKISYGNTTTFLQVIQNESGSDLVSLCSLNLIEPAVMQTQTNF